ncbi:HNH endonuclease domain-containing protein [Polluticoccus soli]|uniref:HNH endonuclease domain-containing protein n=1 Tax=Polluticoccus soli TaxID=3034150 RepID=UPI0023E28042|nr:HNH endonuclease domain-containing protein [Flavipsychrobacter sp. JY13-12]
MNQHPSTSGLKLDESDLILIKEAINNGGKIWENEVIEPVKKKIKAFFRQALNEQCCYCRRDTTDEFNMVLDIEHILPKSVFNHFMFSPFNLSISCKRCNMEIKKEDTSFLFDVTLAKEQHDDSSNYQFLHPNFDVYAHHINVEIYRYGESRLIKYVVLSNSLKGIYTKEYFKLDLLERDSFDSAQGLDVQELKYSQLMDREIISEIEQLFKGHG